MSKISSGIKSLDGLIDFLYVGDNVVWEVEAGTSSHIFIHNFIRQSFGDSQKVIYVSFNKSPQSILGDLSKLLYREYFILIDCFTSGKGKNDNTFLKFYENPPDINIVKINNPKNIDEFTHKLNAIEDSFNPGVRYVFDSLTGMQDLWGNEADTYKFFTYMCPRLYDLGTVAYWLLEKDAHSQAFKANLRHITQVVFDIYKRRDKLYIKALKLEGRQERDAFKPHLYEFSGGDVTVTFPKREALTDIGSKIKDIRMRLGVSQKELADSVDLTSSYISQLENNQISPSLSSFLQICNSLGATPGQFFESKKQHANYKWLFRKEAMLSKPSYTESDVRIYDVPVDEKIPVRIIIFPPETILNRHFHDHKTEEFIYIVNGDIFTTIDGQVEHMKAGDIIYLKDSVPSRWENKGGDETKIVVTYGDKLN